MENQETQFEQLEQSGQPEQSMQTGQPEQSKQAGNSEQLKQPEQPETKLFSRAFVLASLVNFLVFTGWQMLTAGLPVFLDQLHASSFEVGLITTFATGGAVLCRPFVGALVDRYGRKGFLVGGLVFSALTGAAYALFPIVGAILFIRLLHGFGWGFVSTANSTIIADVLPRKRFAEGMGYFTLTSSIGMAIGPAISMALLEAGMSVQMLYGAVGLTLASLVAALFLITACTQPELNMNRSLAQTLKPSNLFEKSALFPSAVMAIASMGFGAVTTFIAVMGASRGITNLALYFVTYAVVNAVSKPSTGRWCDKSGFFMPGIISGLAVAASMICIAFSWSLWQICVAGALCGFGTGTAMSVFNTMSVAIAPAERRGAATSTYMFFFNGGLALGSALGGSLVEPLGYTGMYVAMALFAVASVVVFVAGGRARIDSYHQRQLK